MAERGVRGGKPVAIDDVYECDKVACTAQLEVFFQRIEEWFDALSKQLTALAVGRWKSTSKLLSKSMFCGGGGGS